MNDEQAPSPSPVDLGRAAPEAGARLQHEVRVTTAAKIVARAPGAPPARFESGGERTGRWEVTVNEVNAEAAIRATVHFETIDNRDRAPDGSTRTASHPVSGQTFVVTVGDGHAEVARADGGVLPDMERDMVRRAFSGFGEPPLFARFLPARVEPGHQVSVPPEAANLLMTAHQRLPVSDATLTYQGTSERDGETLAVFDVSATLSGAMGPGMTMHTHQRGRIGIDPATCERAWLETSGDLQLSGERPHKATTMTLAGEGTMTIHLVRRRLS